VHLDHALDVGDRAAERIDDLLGRPGLVEGPDGDAYARAPGQVGDGRQRLLVGEDLAEVPGEALVQAEPADQLRRTTGVDADGNTLDMAPQLWVAAPFDLSAAQTDGTVTFYAPGEVTVLAVLGGQVGSTTVRVKARPPETIEIDPLMTPLVVGGAVQLQATAMAAEGVPQGNVEMVWASDNPAVATVDAAGVVMGQAPGTATIRATAQGATSTLTFEVVPNPVDRLEVSPDYEDARTGDVVRFVAQGWTPDGAPVEQPSIRWTVAGGAATVDASGTFVAEEPGTYLVSAISGEKMASATIA